MPTPEVEEFAKILVEWVRDRAIQECDSTLRGPDTFATKARWNKAALKGPEELAKTLIPDIVDQTIGELLIAIDQGALRLSYTATNGKTADLTRVSVESGDLSGWYQTSEGWCASHTKERYVDDFADLDGFFDKFPDDKT